MLKSFNSLLIDKVQCVSSGNILPEFFSRPLYVHEFFFWHDGLVQEFFSYAYALAGYFVSKSPTPPLPRSEVEWSAHYALRSVRLIFYAPIDTLYIIITLSF